MISFLRRGTKFLSVNNTHKFLIQRNYGDNGYDYGNRAEGTRGNNRYENEGNNQYENNSGYGNRSDFDNQNRYEGRNEGYNSRRSFKPRNDDYNDEKSMYLKFLYHLGIFSYHC